jgi:hypothetical protein
MGESNGNQAGVAGQRPLGNKQLNCPKNPAHLSMSLRNVNLFQRTAQRANGALDKIMDLVSGENLSAAEKMQQQLSSSSDKISEGSAQQPYSSLNLFA